MVFLANFFSKSSLAKAEKITQAKLLQDFFLFIVIEYLQYSFFRRQRSVLQDNDGISCKLSYNIQLQRQINGNKKITQEKLLQDLNRNDMNTTDTT